MSSASVEQTIVSNRYGTVTNKRVIYFADKGWFSGGRREDVPLKQVVSIRYETSRSILMGIFCLLVGLALLMYVVGIIPVAIGVLLLWGSPKVNVVTAGGTATPVVGWPWQRKEAQVFVNALRSQLFSE